MTLIEFIGFIITMIAFFLLIGKQAREERKRRREHPEEYEEELVSQQQQIEEILRTMGVQEEEEAPVKEKREAKPPPPPEERMTTTEEDIEALDKRRAEAAAKVKATSSWLTTKEALFVDVHKKSDKKESIHEDAYDKLVRQQSRVRRSLAGVNTLKSAVILKEVLGPPKGLKGDDYSS